MGILYDLEIIGRRNWSNKVSLLQASLKKSQSNLLPTVPSDFLACHHFPFLSRISSTSPFVKEISLGSSAEAVS